LRHIGQQDLVIQPSVTAISIEPPKNSHLGKIFYDKILKNKKCFGGAVNF